jgi:hypothetical protein
MAVTIELNYGKKLGLPGFSSHQFAVSIHAEVPNLEAVRAEVARVYQILQSSVDEQIVNPGFVPGGEVKAPAVNGSSIDSKPWKCSDKQKALLVKIVDENKLDRSEVEQLATKRFGHGVTLLNKLEMSGLLDELLGKTRRDGGRKDGGVRPFTQRKAA